MSEEPHELLKELNIWERMLTEKGKEAYNEINRRLKALDFLAEIFPETIAEIVNGLLARKGKDD